MMAWTFADIVLVAGRVLLSGLFVFAGVRHFFIIDEVVPLVEARGVPAPRLVTYAGSTFELVAGLCLMFGFYVAAASFGLIVFTIIASLMLLNFWDHEGPPREGMMLGFLTNIAVIGGLLITAAGALR